MKKISTILVIIIMVVALSVIARTYITSAVYVPDTATVDVTSSQFVPNNLDTVASSTVLVVEAGTSSVTVLALSTSTTKMSSSNLKTSIPKPAQKPPDEYPSKMIISSIGVDAHVQNTGITKRGSIGTPNNFTDVAWYVYGPVPGKIGTAIFDGHVDNGLGLPGVFKNLSTITVGDDIEIVTNGGKSIHFSVSDVSSFDYDNVPPAAMFSATGTSQIKLISCEGNWVSAEKTYDKRLIVTALLKE